MTYVIHLLNMNTVTKLLARIFSRKIKIRLISKIGIRCLETLNSVESVRRFAVVCNSNVTSWSFYTGHLVPISLESNIWRGCPQMASVTHPLEGIFCIIFGVWMYVCLWTNDYYSVIVFVCCVGQANWLILNSNTFMIILENIFWK